MVASYFISAAVLASLYSLCCIGLTLTYMTTKVPNFAYGSQVTIGAYVAFSLFTFKKITPYVSAPAAFLIGGIVSVVTYLIVLRPMIKRDSSLIALMIATLAVDTFFVGVFSIYTDYLTNAFRIEDSKLFILSSADTALFGQRGVFVITPLILIAIVLTMHLILTKTKFGIAMRATVENPKLAAISGVNIGLVYLISWFIAGGLGSLAGCLLTLNNLIEYDIGSLLIVVFFAGSVIGGFENIYGAVLGGVIVGASGVLVTLGIAYFVGPWFDAYTSGVPLVLMVIVLILAPHGLTSINLRRR
ncbi:MAG: branched-chain amino acid ABC transporter permease [Conexivisphaerales archaeon]|jgi:branched-chain amino acid transport system permease protein